MLYEITIWRRTASGAQLVATHHELGHLSTVKEAAKRMLQDFPGVGLGHHVKISEAHNGREVFVWKLDGRS
jgi:hypothetical protein